MSNKQQAVAAAANSLEIAQNAIKAWGEWASKSQLADMKFEHAARAAWLDMENADRRMARWAAQQELNVALAEFEKARIHMLECKEIALEHFTDTFAYPQTTTTPTTMKVAVNKCYGGFRLSDKAWELLTKLTFEEGDKEEKALMEEIGQPFQRRQRTPDYMKYLQPEIESHLNLSEWRQNPKLIRVIEELGEAASGDCAQIVIVEIPMGIEWFIQEHDGVESIHEKHRKW
jgi:hypothetical protein